MTKWTDKQLDVINTRDRSILVSAAAGSGKTAVLVERIIRLITDESKDINIDQLLVVTFTNAAASEMRERVRDALEKMAKENPQDLNIKKQLALVHNSYISTIDSFCGKVVRENFERINMDPNYRIADNSEMSMLKSDILDELLEEKYSQGNEEFEILAEQYSNGKLSDNIGNLILELYKNAMAQDNPIEWLEGCIDIYDIKTEEELNKSQWMNEYLHNIKKQLKCYVMDLEKIIPISEETDGPKYLKHIDNFINTFNGLINGATYLDMKKQIKEFSMLGKMVAAKGCDDFKKKTCKDVLDNCKDVIEKNLLIKVFNRSIEEILEEISLSKNTVNMIVSLTKEFVNRLQEAMIDKGIMDFATQEHMALKVLKNPEVSAQMSKQYKEIMIDEYQDSNYLQEAILTSIANGFGVNNMFMVGDVKQSIYRFRKAKPKLFLDKYDDFSEDLNSNQCKIILDKNFRSRKEVINSVNYIFDHIMHKEVGGIDYKSGHGLVLGAKYVDVPDGQDNSTEIIAIETKEKEIEAEFVAQKIKEITDPVDGMKVQDKDGKLRPLKYSDIAILLRSVKTNAQNYLDALENYGIPSYAQTEGKFYETVEIRTIMSLLQVIDNQRQDIPLAAIMLSPIFKFSTDDLAVIKGENQGDSLFDLICLYKDNGSDNDVKDKIIYMLEILEKFRRVARYSTVYELINIILKETSFNYYLLAMPNGKRRIMNLEILKEKAIAYDNISYKGLFNFVRYIERVKTIKDDQQEASMVSENDDVVLITTIHKSKGLQFPVVFLCNTNAGQNNKDSASEIVVSDKGIIGVDAIDVNNRTKSSTLIKNYINDLNLIEEKAEDLRLIYVALTRAQEKLFVTGKVDSLEKEENSLESYRSSSNELMPYSMLCARKSYWYWISRSIARNKAFHQGNGAGIQNHINDEAYVADVDISYKKVYEDEILAAAYLAPEMEDDRLATVEKLKTNTMDSQILDMLEHNFNFDYPNKSEINLHSKASVTEIKKQSMEHNEEIDGHLSYEQQRTSIIPNFAKDSEEDRLYGAQRGTAYHRVFELLDLHLPEYNYKTVENMLNEFVSQGKMTKLQADCIYINDIIKFTESKLFSRMKQASLNGQLFREQKFLMSVKVNDIRPDIASNEPMLIQGIIDVCFIEDGKFVIADYKTDKVDTLGDLVDRYKVQLDCYGIAINQISEISVSDKIIYSVTLGDEITL